MKYVLLVVIGAITQGSQPWPTPAISMAQFETYEACKAAEEQLRSMATSVGLKGRVETSCVPTGK